MGDSGPNDATRWDRRYQHDNTHAILIVHARNEYQGAVGFADFELRVLETLGIANDPLTYVKRSKYWVEQSNFLDDPQEIHFGMLDGISSPQFIAPPLDGQSKDGEANRLTVNDHCLGELLLGYERNDQSNSWQVPGAFSQPTTISGPSRDPVRLAYGEFFRNGTFGALRKMYQDVREFDKYLNQAAETIRGNRDLEFTIGWLKAKMLGRWPNGTPVGELLENTDDLSRKSEQKARIESKRTSGVGLDNGFIYAKDRDGYKCPFGAHIRRMNPRDDPVVPRLRRPLLRRGVPYGEKYLESKENAKVDRGLLGLFFCANLEEQFEHLLGNWADNNPMGMPFARRGKDPLIGNRDSIGNLFEIPMRGSGPQLLTGLGRFVITRGTCYAFFPSVSALVLIAEGRLETASRFLEKA